MKLFIISFISLEILKCGGTFEENGFSRQTIHNGSGQPALGLALEPSDFKIFDSLIKSKSLSSQESQAVKSARNLRDEELRASIHTLDSRSRRTRKLKHKNGGSHADGSKTRKLALKSHKKFERSLVRLYKDLEKNLRRRRLFGPPQGVTQQANGLQDNQVVLNMLGMPANVTSAGKPDTWEKGYEKSDLEPKIVVERLQLPSYSVSLRRKQKKNNRV